MEKMSREIKLFKTTILLIFGTFLPRILNLVTTPLLTSYTSGDEFGFINLLTTTVLSFVIPICTLQLEQACYRYLSDTDTHDERVTIITTSFVMIFLIMIVVAIVCLFIPFPNQVSYFTLLLIIYLWIEIIVQVLRYILRAFDMYKTYTTLSAVVVIVNFIVLYICLVKFDLGYISALIALTVADIVGGIFIVVKMRFFQYIRFSSFNQTVLKELLHYTFPFIPNSIAGYINTLSDQWIVTAVLGLGANGIYTMANKIPSIINLIFPAFNIAWTDSAVLSLKDNDFKKYYSSMFLKLFYFLSVSALGLITISPILFNILNKNPSLSSAIQYVPILIVAFYFQCFTMFFSGILIALKESKIIYQSTFIAAMINVLLNVLFMKLLGVYAAVLSTLISNFVLTKIRHHFLNKNVCKLFLPRRLIIGVLVLFILCSIFMLSNIFILQLLNYIIVLFVAIIFLEEMFVIIKNNIIKKIRG